MVDVHILYDPSNHSRIRIGDVIFLHGINGDSIKTWDFNNSMLIDRLSNDNPDIRLITLGYPAAPFDFLGTAMSLSERTVNILATLISAGIGDKPICLIGHSMGGLLAKQILYETNSISPFEYINIRNSVKGIIFIATPNTGSDILSYLDNLRFLNRYRIFRYFLRPSVALKELGALEQPLIILEKWFRNHFNKLNIRIKIFYETQKCYVLCKLFGKIVVDKKSADPGIANNSPIPVDANHLNIAQIAKHKDMYTIVSDFISETFQKRSETNETILNPPILCHQNLSLSQINNLSFLNELNMFPEEVEPYLKSELLKLPLPPPIQDDDSPEEWIKGFSNNFNNLLNNPSIKNWLKSRFERFFDGYQGLKGFGMIDATLAVPPQAVFYYPLLKRLMSGGIVGLFAATGMGKSRILNYFAYWWFREYNKKVYFIINPKEIKTEEWEELESFLIKHLPKSGEKPILLIIENIQSISDLARREIIRSILTKAGKLTWVVLLAFTENPPKGQVDKRNKDEWLESIRSDFGSYPILSNSWSSWKPYFFQWIKWMASKVLEMETPKKWEKDMDIEYIYAKYHSPWSFVVGLGSLQSRFEEYILADNSNKTESFIYGLIHLFYLLSLEQPISIKAFSVHLYKSSQLMVPINGWENALIDIFSFWASPERRLLPPMEYKRLEGKLVGLPYQIVYHREWAIRVVHALFTPENKKGFYKELCGTLKIIWPKLIEIINNRIIFREEIPIIDFIVNGIVIDESFGLQCLYLTYTPITKLPKSIGKQINLQKLSLSSTFITKLPESIGNLINLKELDLSYTQIQKLPHKFRNLTKLQRLDLSNSGIIKIPKWFGKLTNLKFLNLESSRVKELPESMGKLTDLQFLDLRYTHMYKTELPDTMRNLINLHYLKLDCSEICYPKWFGNLTNLYYLNITPGKQLPEWFNNLTKLQELHLNVTYLMEIPESIWKLNDLNILFLSYSQITKLPESIGNLTNLQELYLNSTQISELPESIWKLIKLKTLDIHSSQVSELPESIGELINLQKLDISQTQIKELPESIGNLSNLEVLNLITTQIKKLPESIGNLVNLKELHLSGYQTPDLPESFKKLTNCRIYYPNMYS